MTDSKDIVGKTFRTRAARAYRETPGRELGPELGRLLIEATRIFLPTIGLSSVFRLIPETTPAMTWQQVLLAAYLVFAVAVMAARLLSWETNVRLRRLAPTLDRFVCVLVVVANPGQILLYIPFLLFLFLAPAGRINRLWLGLEYLALALAILLHNRLADLWPGLDHVDPRLLVLQFALMTFTAVTVLGFRLGQASRQSVEQWNRELFDVSANARQLPIDGIAEKLSSRFGATDLILCWKVEGEDRPNCIRVQSGELRRVDLEPEVIDAVLDPQADGRSFLWDSSSRNALVESSHHGAPTLRHFSQPSVPEILLAKGERICAMPIRSGSIAGYIYLLGLPRISETVLARAVRACEAVNATLDRYQLFEAWRDRAFANARLALSRDMHDSVLQTLAGLRMQVAALIKQGASVSVGERNERLQELQSIIAAEQACLRELLVDSDEQGSGQIDLAGHLAQRIELLSRQWSIRCNLDAGDDPIWVASDVAIEVEFLMREAVSNAVQHAKATNITVSVALREKSLFITLRSNGDRADTPLTMAGPVDAIASRSLSRRLETLRGRAYVDPIESGALLSMRIPVEFGTDV